MRLLLDTNIVVSALLWRGTPYRLVAAIRERGDVKLFTSMTLLDELADVLARPFAARRLAMVGRTPHDVMADYFEGGGGTAERLAFGSLRELFSAITEKRLELLRFVAGHDGLNVRRLAGELGRDYKNVHTDAAELLELGLLERDADGRLSAPFDEIVIHAGIRDAA